MRKIRFSRAHFPLLLLHVATLWAFVFRCDARNGPLLHHTRFQNPAPLNPGRGLRSAEICGKIFGKMRKLSEIASWRSDTVKQGCGKCRKMSEIWPLIFCRPLKCRVQCRPPYALHSPHSNSAEKNFRALWPIVTLAESSQSFEPSISLPNSQGASAHNQAMEK